LPTWVRVTRKMSLILVPVLLLCLAITSAEAEPELEVYEPSDGDWYTEPELRISGKVSPETIYLVFDSDDLAKGTFNHVSLVQGKLEFHPVMQFEDTFYRGPLNRATWEVLHVGGIYSSSRGVHLGPDLNGSFPLIATRGTVIPQGVDWNVRIYITFGFHDDFINGFGFGMTSDKIDAFNSTVAIYGDDGLVNTTHEYNVLIGGEPVASWLFDDYYKGMLEVHYTHTNDTYHLFSGGEYLTSVSGLASPTRFWMGCPDNDSMEETDDYEMVTEQMDVWTFSGTWTSRVYDMGGSITHMASGSDFLTSHNLVGKRRVEYRESSDNISWSEWSGAWSLDDVINGPYIQFRVVMTMDHLRTEEGYVRLLSLTISYQYPIVGISVDLNGGGLENVSVREYWGHLVALTEDLNVIEVRAIDSRGEVNHTKLEVILDTTPPEGTVGSDKEGIYTNDQNFTLFFNATDNWGIKSVHISLYKDFQIEDVIEPYVDTVVWYLPGGFVKTSIYIRFEDNHGHLSETARIVVYHDPLPPTGELRIEDGVPHTQNRSVLLGMTYHDNSGIARVELSNDPEFRTFKSVEVDNKWFDGWDLSEGGSGPRTVHMRIIDLAGNHIVVSAEIDLYVAEALGELAIVGNGITASTVVQLTIYGPTDFEAMWMQISEDPTFRNVLWTDLNQYAAMSLAEGDGRREILVRFKDTRGYITLPVSAEVLLDTTSPEISLVVNDGVYLTQTYTMDVEVEYEDLLDPVEMWISEVNDRTMVQPAPFNASFQWSFPDREGIHTLNVWVSDSVGNVGKASGSVYYAIVPPYCIPSIVGGKYSNATSHLEVEVQTIDQYGLPVEIQIGFDGEPEVTSQWITTDGVISLKIPPGTVDGRYLVTVRGRNSLGLVSETVSTDVVLDRTRPVCVIVRPTLGSLHVIGSPIVDLKFERSDLNDIVEISYSIDGGEWIRLKPRSEGDQVYLSTFGNHTIAVRVVDEAGNEVVVETTFTVEKDLIPMFLTVGILVAGIIALAIIGYRRKRRLQEKD